MILEIAAKVCSVFLIIGAGYIAARCKLVPEDASGVLSKVLFNIAIPASVLTSMQGQDLGGELLSDTVWSFASYGGLTVLIGLVTLVVTGRMRVPEADKGIYRIELAFTNVGFMGIPLVTAVFGGRTELVILLMNTVYVVLVYSFGVFLILYEKGRGGLDRELLKKMVNIPLVSSLLGVVIMLTGLRLPDMVNSGLELMAGMMVPVGMLLVGIQLGKEKHASLVSRQNMAVCALSLVATPLVAMGLGALLPMSDAVKATLVYAMAMPPATMSVVFAEQFGRNTRLASETLAFSTFLSLVTLPIWAVVLEHVYAL